MKSIAKEIVNEYKELVKKQNIIDGNEIFRDVEIKAKQHTLTCQTILDNNRKFGIMGKELMNIIKWCESEIKILKDGGLI